MVHECFELFFFFSVKVLLFTSFFETALQNLQSFGHRNTRPWMAGGGGCYLLSEKQRGAPSFVILFAHPSNRVVLDTANTHFNTQIVAILPPHSC